MTTNDQDTSKAPTAKALPSSSGSGLPLEINEGQTTAKCPNCDMELSKKYPIIKDEYEVRKTNSCGHGLVCFRPDPRPKCPHCHARLAITIHIQNK